MSGEIYPKNKNLAELIQEQVIRTPEKIAFYSNDQSITYDAFNKLANQLGHWIEDNLKSVNNKIIVYMDRRVETLVSLFSILKSNNTYVPVDFNTPEKLFKNIIDDCRPALIVTNATLSLKIKNHLKESRVKVFNFEESKRYLRQCSKENLIISGDHSIAYVLYTSGSTGKPKGVQITHDGIINLLYSMRQKLLFESTERLLAITPLTFDISGADIYLPLLTGASFVFANDGLRYDPYKIIAFISEHDITIMQATPPTWQMLVNIGWKNEKNIKIISTGEALNTRLALKLFNHNFPFWNLYGPTETTIWSTYYKIEHIDQNRSIIPIGKPIANTQVYVLNEKMEPQQVGEPGELYIGGDGLSVGYLNRPELNQKSFILNPFSKNKNDKLYKTGDLVLEDKDGNLHYLGRIDTQIKIRGHRIEAGAIENLLLDYSGIKECVVLDKTPEHGRELVAYLILDETVISLSLKDIQKYLKLHFPNYMVPTKYVIVKKFPVTSSGKIDRKLIPNIREFRYLQHEKSTAPLINKYEEILVDLIRSFLQRDDIHPESNFFDLGLHSILLVNIAQALNRILSEPISVVELFEHPTVRSFSAFLMKAHHIDYTKTSQVKDDTNMLLKSKQLDAHDKHIAVIGMACKVPGADNYKNFWELIVQKKEAIQFFNTEELRESGIISELYFKEEYVRARGILLDIDKFDAEFFGYTPAEARIMDPQHRIFLEQSWSALEDAGYSTDNFSGKIGVYAGMNDSTYLSNHLLPNEYVKKNYDIQQLLLATSTHYLSTKVSYALGLKGPSITINTACSTGLVSIAMACNALMTNDCDMAIAGAVTVVTPQKSGYLYQELGILSPDGHCRVFDSNSQGTVLSNGCGVVVLKRLSDSLRDNDNILGVIRGWSLNNDGAAKVGFTAPSVEGQINCVREALSRAEVASTEVEYIEAHGTGTLIGDPVEVASLSKAYDYETHQKSQYCALGSVKANIGHTDSASGAIGFIKTILALQHKILPPQINYTKSNSNINFEHSPYYVNCEPVIWETQHKKRTAAVHSLGFGGTNAHVILQEPPSVKTTDSKNANLFVVSAKNERSLQKAIDALHQYIVDLLQVGNVKLCLADLMYTLQVGRKAFEWRAAVAYQSCEHLIYMLSNKKELKQNITHFSEKKQKRVVFGFTGQGSQYAGMAHNIYCEHPYFKQIIDECCSLLQPELNIDLRALLFPKTMEQTGVANQKLRETQYTQPALFVIEYALAKLLISFGVSPDAMIGHSIGEYVAATLSGVLSLDNALKLVAARAKLMASTESGSMLVVPLSKEKLEPYLNKGVELAVHNAPNFCVVAGLKEEIMHFGNEIQALLKVGELKCRLLNTSHAFHSKQMDSILDDFYTLSSQYPTSEPKIPYISNVTGTWISPKEIINKHYWTRHLRNTVLFSEGVEALDLNEQDVFIEIGPGRVLTQLIQQHKLLSRPVLLQTLSGHAESHQNSYECFLNTLGKLWLHHFVIDWEHLYTNEIRQRRSAPTYQFDRKSYWIESNGSSQNELDILEDATQKDELQQDGSLIEQLKTIWTQVLGIEHIDVDDDFYEIGGHSLLAVNLLSRINNNFNIKIPSTILFKTKTIRGLSAVIESYEQEHEIYSPLVTLRQGNTSNPALFIIHPVGGTVFCYMQLADSINTDRTIYAFQDPSIEAEKPLFSNIEEMAAFYLKHIRKIQAHGPYYICGASFGSIVATEIAYRLEQENETVNFVGIIDGWGKHNKDSFDINYVRQIILLHHLEPHQNIEIEKQSLWESLLHKRLNMMLGYQYKKISSPCVLFKAQDVLSEYREIDAFDNHWSQYAINFTFTSVSGDHNSMLKKPNVVVLAEKIKAHLD